MADNNEMLRPSYFLSTPSLDGRAELVMRVPWPLMTLSKASSPRATLTTTTDSFPLEDVSETIAEETEGLGRDPTEQEIVFITKNYLVWWLSNVKKAWEEEDPSGDHQLLAQMAGGIANLITKKLQEELSQMQNPPWEHGLFLSTVESKLTMVWPSLQTRE